jgi:hypothetical protein
MAKWKKFAALPIKDQLLLSEAVLLLGLMRTVLVIFPIRRLSFLLGRPQSVSPPSSPAPASASVRRIAWAIAAAARRLPWESTCLTQALAGKWMLRKRGLAGTIYFGALVAGDKKLRAHAWLACDGYILTGEREMAGYTAISSFT